MYDEVSRSGEPGHPYVVKGFGVPPPRERARFSAGVGVEDITPPPGFPTGGHGPAGDVARGYWIRLRARAFFFEDRAGHALALVSADLFAVPAGLHARVAARIAEMNREVSLPPESLVIAANHTHHGPGNFATARVYNQFGSAYYGFQKDLLDFLADQIASAISKAVKEARDHSDPVEVAVHLGRVGYDLLRNRGPASFELNQDRDAILAALNDGDAEPECRPRRGEPEDGWNLPGCPRLRAADRSLTVFEVVRVAGERRRRIGALVFFAAHPTVLEADTPFYSPDFIGYAMQAVETRLAADDGTPVVVGFFNGAEGDITLRRTRRDLLGAFDFGKLLARETMTTLEAQSKRILRDPVIAVRSRTLYPGRGDGQCGEAKLASAPKFGAATVGGSEDDRTQLYLLGWRDGVRGNAVDGQGVKLPALDSRVIRGLRFSDLFAPPEAFPASISLTLASLGDLTVAAIPAEVTTSQGRAIRERLGLPHGRLELVGLANDYVSYCSSRDEYWAQDYMGASTIWGPEEGPFIACRLEELSRSAAATATRVPDREFMPGSTPKEPFGLRFTANVDRPDDGLDTVLRDSEGAPERHLPWFEWNETAGSDEYAQARRRRISVWTESPGGWRPLQMREPALEQGARERPEDDSGAGFLTMYLGNARWAAIWLRRLFDSDLSGRFAVVVEIGRSLRCSMPFSVAPHRPGPDRIHAADSCPDAVRNGYPGR